MGKKSYLILILVLGFGLRLINLNQSLWLDEASQAIMSRQSLSFIWFGRGGDFHPPLFYLLSHFWLDIGNSNIWLRLLPVFIGVINIIILYKLAEYILPVSAKSGLIAGFLLAISPYHIYFSQEFRSYSLLCLLGTWAIWLYAKKSYHLLAVANSLIIYTHYSGFFLLLTQIIHLIFYRRKDLSKFIISLFITSLLYLPWLPQLLNQLSSGVNINQYLPGWKNILSVSPIKALPLILFKLVAGRINILSRYLYGLYILSVLGITFCTLLISKISRQFLVVFLFLPILSMLFISLVLPQNQPFRVIYVLPIIVIFFTQSIIKFPKLFLTLFIYISLVGNILYFTRPRLQREQWQAAAEYLKIDNLPVVVKFPESFAPLQWYESGLKVVPAVTKFPAQVSEVESSLSNLDSDQVYLLQYLTDLTDPSRIVEEQLIKQKYSLVQTTDFQGVGFIYKYQK